MGLSLKKELIKYLSEFITENKRQKIEKVLASRTKYITVALEDIYQPQNASAVVRTCECLGIQEIYVIENKNKYEINPDVVVGASKWVDIIKFNRYGERNTTHCIEHLKNKGYRIVATSPHLDGYTPENVPIDCKLALLFGTEETGLTEEAIANADITLRIPQYGFTESYNLSVSAAICLYTISKRLRNSSLKWTLKEEEKLEIQLKWIKKILKRAEVLEREFLNRKRG